MYIFNSKYNLLIFNNNNSDFKFLRNILFLFKQIIIITNIKISKILLFSLLNNIDISNNLFIIEIPDGEKYKNIYICTIIWKILNTLNINRNSIIINLGGGVITDLGGFISSTFKRGIEFINIPTSLLSMIDASFGGKTAIDLDVYKNIIGVFNESKILIINKYYLKYLPYKELLSGLFEIIKYILLFNENFWDWFKLLLLSNNIFKNISDIIIFSLMIKEEIISNDYYEILGERKLLNFGHTIGHAIETYFLSIKKPITHGYSIGYGMLYELFISTKIFNFPIKKYIEIFSIISILLEYDINDLLNMNIINALYYINFDKKNIDSNINFTMLKDIGYPLYDCLINNNDILDILKYILLK